MNFIRTPPDPPVFVAAGTDTLRIAGYWAPHRQFKSFGLGPPWLDVQICVENILDRDGCISNFLGYVPPVLDYTGARALHGELGAILRRGLAVPDASVAALAAGRRAQN